MVGYTLAGTFNSGAFFSWIALSSYLLIEVYGVAPANFGWWFGANAAGFIGMSQVNAHLMRWFTPEEVLVRARLASIASAVVLVVDAFTGFGGMLGVIVPLYATLASFGLVGPNTQAAAMNVDPTRAGSISSITGATTFAMGAIVSSVSGFLHDGTSRPLAGLILALIIASSAALYGLAKPTAALRSRRLIDLPRRPGQHRPAGQEGEAAERGDDPDPARRAQRQGVERAREQQRAAEEQRRREPGPRRAGPDDASRRASVASAW